ncbi:hypothetical protein ACRQ5Q_44150 (plasmid) [Bradyrhizobium sp. PMVTL-01]|uniref:hypothetical protein n=1 Tax=Bradyrhizobium sp. PMVTL-01 TaxID=3434999 RepID=UPI003F7097AC
MTHVKALRERRQYPSSVDLEIRLTRRNDLMKCLSSLIGGAMALMVTAASAQSINLTGQYTCVQACRGGMLAVITQNGPELNLTTEAGVPSRAWLDWIYPNSRIWIDAYDISAVYTPDGMTIQFDNGTVWQRYIPPSPAPVIHRRR